MIDKRCNACKATKSPSEFSKNRNLVDGLNGRCKDCDHKAYARRVGYEPKRKGEALGYPYGATCRIAVCMDCGGHIPGSPGRAKRQRCEDCKPQCEVCGIRFKPQTSKGIVQRTCSRECGAWVHHGWSGQTCDVVWVSCAICHTVRRWQGKHCCRRPVVRAPQYCPECGDGFLGRGNQTYCTPRCATRAHNRHRRHVHRQSRRLVKRTGRRSPWADIRTDCAECGLPLTGRRRKWCSKACCERATDRHDRHLARTAPVLDAVPVFTTRQIAERDGWRCHICRRTVTPEQASMDHLVPVSDGGRHVPGNVALAHHLCNSRAGDQRQSQLLLVA